MPEPINQNPPQRDVLSLAARGEAPMGQQQPGMAQGGQQGADPVMAFKQAVGLLLQVANGIPQLKPVVMEFLQKASQATQQGQPQQPPVRPAPPAGGGQPMPGAGAPPPMGGPTPQPINP